MSWDLVYRTDGGYTKWDTPEGYRYRDSDGHPVKQQSFAASKQNEDYETVITHDDDGKIKSSHTFEKEDDDIGGGVGPDLIRKPIVGDIQELKKGIKITIDVDSILEAERILEENRRNWSAFQIRSEFEYMCKNQGEKFEIEGFSKVHTSLDRREFQKAVTERVTDEDTGESVERFSHYETIKAGSVEIAQLEAQEHAYATIDCSVMSFDTLGHKLVIYIDPPSYWYDEAKADGVIYV